MSAAVIQMGVPERRYLLPGIVVFGGALIAYFVGVLPTQGEASRFGAALAEQHGGVTAALAAPGGPPTKGALDAAGRAREQLAAEAEKCAQLYRDADAVLEGYFKEYEGRRGIAHPSSFRRAYLQHARSLMARAEAVAARDANGQKVAPFTFRDYESMPPAETEIPLAQKQFWIQRALLGAVEGVAGARLHAVRVATLPEELRADLAATLPSLRVTPTDADPWTKWQWIEATVEAECRGAQVGAFLAAVQALTLGEPEQRLLSELRAVQVTATGKVDDVVEVKYDPKKGQTPESMVDIDAMEPPVRVRVTLAVLDPPTVGRMP